MVHLQEVQWHMKGTEDIFHTKLDLPKKVG
jgi:hypothetical protein